MGYSAIPTAVFTIPELVRVGMLENEAEESGLDVDVRFTDTSGWFSNYRIGETTGATKILVDKNTDRIIGAHLLGHDYAELANTIALAMKNGLTTRQSSRQPQRTRRPGQIWGRWSDAVRRPK